MTRYIIILDDCAIGPFRSREAAEEYVAVGWPRNDRPIYELYLPVDNRITMDA